MNDENQMSHAVDSSSGSRPLVPPKPGEGGLVPPERGEGGLVPPKPSEGGSEGGSTLDPQPRIWLTASTNIEGYVFVPEPVSVEVRKILGGTKRDDSRCLER